MLRNDLYYLTKPFLPWRLRIGLRRFIARRTRALNRDLWPIDEGAARAPENWPGWPEDRQFAVVLTHDVEGPDGLEKCRELAELERALGFRSSFNFIPEAGYTVPPGLREWLVREGFEIGIHDLHHDGHLFDSAAGFARKAERINYYLREWHAVGFRAGFMMRNLDWYHHLDIAYDSSTFDTDPFEPQPNGVRTIFPFWLSASEQHYRPGPGERDDPSATSPAPRHANQPGYIELPYTLPQDSTLFVVFRESTPEIWLNKVNWIASHGGMVLVNTHPDYMNFGADRSSRQTYDVAHYRELLQYLRERYEGRFWHALPRQVATHVTAAPARATLHLPRRIAMITHSAYESDNRVTRYAKCLAERGDHVDVLALRSSPSLAVEERLNGVNVFRIQNRFGKSQRRQIAYAWPLVRFFFASGWNLSRRHLTRPYELVHVHNMPDFLVFAACWPKWSGARIVLDIHDLVPEFYRSKFGSNEHGMPAATLRRIERWSARFADHVIISNHLWLDKFAARTGTTDRCSVFINNVDASVFRTGLRTRENDRTIILFPGGLQWHQGLDIALRAFTRVQRELPKAEFHIYGDGIMKPTLVTLARDLGLNGSVKFFEPVRIEQIARVMADADIGVVPKRADSFGNEAYSTKIMEFMSLGVPVIVSRTKIDQYYFDDSVVRFFESGDADALAKAMLDVLRDETLRDRLVTNASAYALRNSWGTRKRDYLQLVDTL